MNSTAIFYANIYNGLLKTDESTGNGNSLENSSNLFYYMYI